MREKIETIWERIPPGARKRLIWVLWFITWTGLVAGLVDRVYFDFVVYFSAAHALLFLAYTLAFCGETDLSFEWLERAATVRKHVALAAVHPFLRNLHDDPRWLPFLESIGKSPDQLAGVELNFSLPPLTPGDDAP